jgi:hypothetical protein
MSDSQSLHFLPDAMNFEEKQILDFLKALPGVYFSVTEIARKAGTRKQFYDNPTWPRPYLVNLVQQKELGTNSLGQFCYKGVHEKKKRRYKIGGHLQPISHEEAAQHTSLAASAKG